MLKLEKQYSDSASYVDGEHRVFIECWADYHNYYRFTFIGGPLEGFGEEVYSYCSESDAVEEADTYIARFKAGESLDAIKESIAREEWLDRRMDYGAAIAMMEGIARRDLAFGGGCWSYSDEKGAGVIIQVLDLTDAAMFRSPRFSKLFSKLDGLAEYVTEQDFYADTFRAVVERSKEYCEAVIGVARFVRLAARG